MLLLTKSKILCAKASASETLLSRPLVGRAVTYTFIRNFVPVLTPLRGVTGTEELSLSLLRSKSGPFGGTRNFVPVRRKCTVRTPFLLKLEVRSSYRRAKPPSGVTGTEFRVRRTSSSSKKGALPGNFRVLSFAEHEIEQNCRNVLTTARDSTFRLSIPHLKGEHSFCAWLVLLSKPSFLLIPCTRCWQNRIKQLDWCNSIVLNSSNI